MATPNTEEVKSKKTLAMERMANKYPDKDFTDEEALFGQINDDYDDYDSKISGYKDTEDKLTNMFTSDPRSAALLHSWSKGDDPIMFILREFGTDIKDALDDPARQEEIAAANKEFLDRVAKSQKLDEEYQTNLQNSLQQLEKLQQEKGLSDEQIDDAMEFLVNIVKNGVMGLFTPESIEMALKAVNHDADVAAADHEAEVRGRNAKIDEKLRTRKAGDGTATLDGKNAGATDRPMPTMGALDNYSDGNKNIWERGGEQRKKFQ